MPCHWYHPKPVVWHPGVGERPYSPAQHYAAISRQRQVPQGQHLCAAGQGAVTDLMSDARFCLISLES